MPQSASGVLATFAAIAYFAVDAAYWAYEWDWWGWYADGNIPVLMTAMVATAGVIGLFAGTCTAVAAWITVKINPMWRTSGLPSYWYTVPRCQAPSGWPSVSPCTAV